MTYITHFLASALEIVGIVMTILFTGFVIGWEMAHRHHRPDCPECERWVKQWEGEEEEDTD